MEKIRGKIKNKKSFFQIILNMYKADPSCVVYDTYIEHELQQAPWRWMQYVILKFLTQI